MKDLATEQGGRFFRGRALVATPPRAVIGLEAEFNLFVNGRRRRPERVFGDPSRLVRRRMIPRTGKSFQLPAGGAIYFDTGVIEVATPIVELEPGCCYRATRLLWEQIRYLRRELDHWAKRNRCQCRLEGFSTHYNFSFPSAREIKISQRDQACLSARAHFAGSRDLAGCEPSEQRGRRTSTQDASRGDS